MAGTGQRPGSRSAALRRSVDSGRAAAERSLERAQRTRGTREALASLRSEQRAGAALLAGGLGYRFFLWLVPFGLVVAALASFWVRLDPTSLEDTARSFGLGGVAAHSATVAVESGSRARWYLLLAGLAVTVWAGIGAVRALHVASHLAWQLDPQRLPRPLRSSAVFAALCLIGLGASILASWVRHEIGALGIVVTFADAPVYGLLALFAYTHLPRPEGTSWRTMWPGALIVGCGMTGVHIFLAYYLAGRLERSPSLYGTLGAATVVLLVLYLIARLLVAGMFLNATVRRGAGRAGPAHSQI